MMPWPSRAPVRPPPASLEQRVAALEADQEAADQEGQLYRRRLDEFQGRLDRIVKAISAQLGTRLE